MQLGIRQAGNFGHSKTKFQLHPAATVANLTLLADKIGLSGEPGPTFPCPPASLMLPSISAPICAATYGGSWSACSGVDGRGTRTKRGFRSESLGCS